MAHQRDSMRHTHGLQACLGQDEAEELAAELKRLREERAELMAEYVELRVRLFWRERGMLVLVLAALVVGVTLLAARLLR